MAAVEFGLAKSSSWRWNEMADGQPSSNFQDIRLNGHKPPLIDSHLRPHQTPRWVAGPAFRPCSFGRSVGATALCRAILSIAVEPLARKPLDKLVWALGKS